MKLGAYDYLTKPFSRDELRLVGQGSLHTAACRRRMFGSGKSCRPGRFRSLVGISDEMQVFDMVRGAATEATVLITGESGPARN
jgi:two-component system NtrC family response regulator